MEHEFPRLTDALVRPAQVTGAGVNAFHNIVTGDFGVPNINTGASTGPILTSHGPILDCGPPEDKPSASTT